MEEYKFKGNWICPREFCEVKPKNVFHRQLSPMEIKAEVPQNLHILYRKTFSYSSGKAVIRISADDYYKLYINGEFVTSGPAAGFNFNYYYNEIDITDRLFTGDNIIAVHTYYQGLINRVWVSGDDRVGLIFDITENGNVIVKSDETVKCRVSDAFTAIGKVGYDTQFMERQDSRSLDFGFYNKDFSDSSWECAKICKFADYNLVKQPIKDLQFETVFPKKIEKTETSVTVDFGSIYAGYLEASLSGKNGDKVTVFYAQELDEKGDLRYNLRANCEYKEEWILSGKCDKREEFDYKSFRYAKLIFPKGTKIENVKMTIRHYPFELKKECSLKDESLEKIWDLCINTLKYGVQDGIFDCLEREKGQYLGDGSFTSTAFAVLTEDASIMERLIDEALRTDFINDGLMTCSPCSFMQEIAEYSLMLPQLLASHYAVKKDKEFVKNRYDKLTKMLDFYRDNYEGKDGLLYDLDKWCVVDWPQNARDGYDFDLSEGKIAKGTHNAINAYYIGAINTINRLAKLIGKGEYRDTKMLKDSYLKNFFDSSCKLFCDTPKSNHKSLASNALALRFDLCPDKQTEENIVDMILKKDAESSAFFITFASLLALLRLGRKEELVTMLKDDGRWQRMLKEGATVTFEAWGKDVKWNTSLFHLCYSYAVLFMTDWDYQIIL